MRYDLKCEDCGKEYLNVKKGVDQQLYCSCGGKLIVDFSKIRSFNFQFKNLGWKKDLKSDYL